MLRSFDLVLIVIMTAAAVVTYTIKHHADEKLTEVRRLEAEIKLEKDTIDLLKADWALLTQPNRLERLIGVYNSELQLQPTETTQLAMPKELPMPKSRLPQPETTIEDIIAGKNSEVAAALKGVAAAKARAPEKVATTPKGPVTKPSVSGPGSTPPVPRPRNGAFDVLSTGSVKR